MLNLPVQFLEEQKRVLHERKEKLIQQLKSFANQDPRQIENFNSDFSQFGDDEDENAAEVAAFEGNLHLEETLETSLEMINKALKKIEERTYGICEKCHGQIGQERLQAMPTATRCTNKTCKKKV
ncbi:TraR/DksA C4-type zinc finger protein [Patescibacteria group bacterium]|nr:TraR/DksA C4-type zinc finger protein [Patescibacteria group bacterium]